jgi:quercetin dioxygenase-like cupin family protein
LPASKVGAGGNQSIIGRRAGQPEGKQSCHTGEVSLAANRFHCFDGDKTNNNCGRVGARQVKRTKMNSHSIPNTNNNASARLQTRRVRLTILGWLGLAAGLSWAQPAAALSAIPISQGQLPSGEIISIIQLTLDPGDTVPWHYHTGPGWGTIVSGTLTEDEGCGTTLNVYVAGSAFAETPGKVHRVFNYGNVPLVLTWTEIYPGCDPDGGTVFVDGPRCEGSSGRSHLEKVVVCAP